MAKNYWRNRTVNGETFSPAEQAELDRDWLAESVRLSNLEAETGHQFDSYDDEEIF